MNGAPLRIDASKRVPQVRNSMRLSEWRPKRCAIPDPGDGERIRHSWSRELAPGLRRAPSCDNQRLG